MTNKSIIKILVLDDDQFTLKLFVRMLENSGYTTVVTCDNGRAALELVDTQGAHPDLILLDLNMPEMDGVEFVRHLVEHRYTGSLILFSGEDEQMLQAAEKLVEAAVTLAREPGAMQLRYLNAFQTIANDKTQTIILPLPMDILKKFGVDQITTTGKKST